MENMEVIDEIKFTHVKTGKKSVSFEWMLNGGDLYSYEGKYDVTITEDGAAFYHEEFRTDDGELEYQVETKEFVCGKCYSMTLSTGGTEDSAVLIVDTFQELQGTYDGRVFLFRWEVTPERFLPAGFCSLSENGRGGSVSEKVNPFYGMLRIENLHYTGKNPVQAVFTADDGKVSAGPDNEPMYFYPQGVQILEAGLSSGGSEETLTLILRKNYENVPAVRLLFMRRGKLLLQKDSVEIREEERNYRLSVSIAHAEMMPQTIRECEVHAMFVNGNAVTAVETPLCVLPLAVPSVVPLRVGRDCEGALTMESEAAPAGYEFTDQSVAYSDTAICPPDFKARARYDYAGLSRRGPWSSGGFAPCYYAEQGVIFYREKSFAEAEVKYLLPASWFIASGDTAMESAVTAGAFTLTPGETTYELAVRTDAAVPVGDYDCFLNAVKDMVRPQAFYALTAAIARMTPCAFEDTAHFQCACTPQERYADLRPGLFMRIETSVYQPQYNTEARNSAGLSWTNTAECAITFSEATGFLEFDSFAAQMLKSANASARTQNAPSGSTKVCYAAGVADLLRPALRQPYFRLLYPSSFPKMDVSVPYLSNNTTLMAADSYGKILSACELLKADPQAINTLPVPVALFRGRGIISLYMEVSVQGKPCYIPVGSSLEQALAKYGVGSTKNVRFFRRGRDGKRLRVYGDIEGIVLLNGDCMEISD